MNTDKISIDNSSLENQFDEKTFKKGIYKDRAIWVGSFIGGPLVAGYLIGQNFKVFNETTKFKITWIIAVVVTVIVFGGVFLIPNPDKVPRQIIPLIYTGIAFYLVKKYQDVGINKHINAGGIVYNWWRVLAISLVGLVITITPILCVALFTDSKIDATVTTKSYGSMKHEIIFDKNNISEIEVNNIANGLTETVFFDNAVKKSVYVKKSANMYAIYISCDAAVINNQDAMAPFVQLRSDMQKLFPNNKIVLNLVVDSIDNVVKRIE
jgi:hypothetical protein